MAGVTSKGGARCGPTPEGAVSGALVEVHDEATSSEAGADDRCVIGAVDDHSGWDDAIVGACAAVSEDCKAKVTVAVCAFCKFAGGASRLLGSCGRISGNWKTALPSSTGSLPPMAGSVDSGRMKIRPSALTTASLEVQVGLCLLPGACENGMAASGRKCTGNECTHHRHFGRKKHGCDDLTFRDSAQRLRM